MPRPFRTFCTTSPPNSSRYTSSRHSSSLLASSLLSLRALTSLENLRSANAHAQPMLTLKSEFECNFLIVEFGYPAPGAAVGLGGGGGGSSSSDDSFSVNWRPQFSQKDKDDDDVLQALAFGEPHIALFGGGDPLFVNDVGDFHLLRMGIPSSTNVSLCPMDLVTLVGLFGGVQIRFLPGLWVPKFSMAVSLALKFGLDTVEIRQQMNDPIFSTDIYVNGALSNDTTSTALFTIERLTTAAHLAGLGGAVEVKTPLFTLRWSPFSVAVALEPITTASRQCPVVTGGLFGSVSDMSASTLTLRSGDVIPRSQDPNVVTRYALSWNVLQNESLLSNWVPAFSTLTNTTAVDVALCQNQTSLSYVSAYGACWKEAVTSNPGLDVLSKLYEGFCSNAKLSRFITERLRHVLNGCAFDVCITNDTRFSALSAQTIRSVMPSLPISCDVPILAFYDSNIDLLPGNVTQLQLVTQSTEVGIVNISNAKSPKAAAYLSPTNTILNVVGFEEGTSFIVTVMLQRFSNQSRQLNTSLVINCSVLKTSSSPPAIPQPETKTSTANNLTWLWVMLCVIVVGLLVSWRAWSVYRNRQSEEKKFFQMSAPSSYQELEAYQKLTS